MVTLITYESSPGQFSDSCAVTPSSYGYGSIQIMSNLHLSSAFPRHCPLRPHSRIIRVLWRIIILAQLVHDIAQSIVLPAYQNIARPVISLDHILDALCIVPVTRDVDGEAKVAGDRRYGVEGSFPGAVYNTC